MCEHARLHGDGVATPHLVEQKQQIADRFGGIAGRINAHHRVTAPEQQPVEDTGCHTRGVIGGVVGLQPRRQTTR